MVATSEAHDSGLCAAPPSVKAVFASDLLNLTLASPRVNRHSKGAKDVAEWTPALNACWFVARTLGRPASALAGLCGVSDAERREESTAARTWRADPGTQRHGSESTSQQTEFYAC